MVATINSHRQRDQRPLLGWINPSLYKNYSLFANDITSGLYDFMCICFAAAICRLPFILELNLISLIFAVCCQEIICVLKAFAAVKGLLLQVVGILSQDWVQSISEGSTICCITSDIPIPPRRLRTRRLVPLLSQQPRLLTQLLDLPLDLPLHTHLQHPRWSLPAQRLLFLRRNNHPRQLLAQI